MRADTRKILRCAIYTRKSTEHGLDQEFNSLDAQREACEAYIKSQASQGWRVLPQPYDDPAYSSGNLDRPALKKLLREIEAGRIDVVVVYKIDRLTRSLADFAKLVETFDARSISFVAVTQQFNTTTSMGRLTLNVLLSFAQFERKLASERVRDKVAASRKKGKWTGGTVPLGYDAKDKKLIVNKAEAETVRTIFRRYLELKSFSRLVAGLDKRGIVTKRQNTKVPKYQGGIPFTTATQSDFARWGYPRWWGRFTGGLEMMSAVLIALPVSRIVGLALGAVIIVAAVLTVLRHREFTHLVPLSVFVVLIALAETLS